MKEIDVPEVLDWCSAALARRSLRPGPAQALRAEASHRQFYRLQTNAASVVLMISPPDLERNEKFLTLAQVFRAHHVGVPEVLDHAPDLGAFLLTDLGDLHLEDLYGTARQDPALTVALDTLHQLATVQSADLDLYTRDRFEFELSLFNDWFMGQWLGMDADPSPFTASYGMLIEAALEQPQCCVHLDYHCRNLLFDDGRLGLVDFQDARLGPRLYDVASLLRDCYHTFSEAQVDRWFDYFLSGAQDLATIPRPTLKRWFDYTAIQRQLKAVGIFARLKLRDSKPSHLEHIVPVLERLHRLTGEYPDLHPLQHLIGHTIDPARVRLAGGRGHPAS